MGLMNEYIDKKFGPLELEAELKRLIDEYNKHRNTYLLIYYTAIDKPIPDAQMTMADYYIIHDFLNGKDIEKIDVFLQTPGGSGEAAEEIVRILRNKTKHVSFVISGEAKSAGTILALSGNDILMTNTGSLGPIDAQVKLGRSVVSAFDYVEWVEQTRNEALKNGTLNPFDATIVAQITPGELSGVLHSLKYAEDLVVEWLPKYKFADWEKTETKQIPVSKEMKEKRAKEVVEQLINHARWRSHGRSIKIEDLKSLLKIEKIDDDPVLADIVYRIDVVLRFLCDTTSAYKAFVTADSKIFRHATPANQPPKIPIPSKEVNVVQVDQNCPKCGFVHKIYAKTKPDPVLDIQATKNGFKPFPKNCKIKCTCGQEIDILGLKNEIESQLGVKLII